RSQLPPSSPLFPYTTLFRSPRHRSIAVSGHRAGDPRGLVRHRRSADPSLTAVPRPPYATVAGRMHRRPRPLTPRGAGGGAYGPRDRKSTRLNSSHVANPYAV